MGEIKEKEDNWECKFSEEVGRDGIQSSIWVITLIGREGKKDSADVGKCVGEVTGGWRSSHQMTSVFSVKKTSWSAACGKGQGKVGIVEVENSLCEAWERTDQGQRIAKHI